MNHTQLLWTLVSTQLFLIGFAWTAAIPISRAYRDGVVGLVAFNLVLGLSLVLIAFRSQLPYFVGHPLSNVLTLWSVVALVQAGGQLLKTRIAQKEIWAVMALSTLGILGFGFSADTANWRAAALFLGLAWMLARNGIKILQFQPPAHLQALVRTAAYACMGLALLFLARAVAGLVSQDSIEFNATDPLTQALPFVVLVGTSLTNLGFAYLAIASVVRKLRRRARSDELTGLLNRKSLSDEIKRAWSQFAATQQPFAVVCLDIDNLRSVNAAHGYSGGDLVLSAISQALQDLLKPEDVMGRAGGGKMVAVLAEATLESACRVAEHMRACVIDTQTLLPGVRLNISASIGVAQCGKSDDSEASVLARANAHLAAAKATGRNCVVWEDAFERPTTR